MFWCFARRKRAPSFWFHCAKNSWSPQTEVLFFLLTYLHATRKLSIKDEIKWKKRIHVARTLITCSSVDLHSTDSVTSETAPSVPTVTTFSGTATVRPVSTAVLRISVSCQVKKKHTHTLNITIIINFFAAASILLYPKLRIHWLIFY